MRIRKMLASSAALCPMIIATSCGSHLNNNFTVSCGVPEKMYGARLDPKRYDELKSSPFVVWKSINEQDSDADNDDKVYVKNDFVKFSFTKEFIREIVEPLHMTVEQFSSRLFQSLNLSPATELMNSENQFFFSSCHVHRGTCSVQQAVAFTWPTTDMPIDIFPTNDASLNMEGIFENLEQVVLQEYFQMVQTSVYSRPWPTPVMYNSGTFWPFLSFCFDKISDQLREKGIAFPRFGDLFLTENSSLKRPVLNQKLKTDYSFLEKWNTNTSLKKTVEDLIFLLNNHTEEDDYRIGGPLESWSIEFLKRFYALYTSDRFANPRGMVSEEVYQPMFHTIALAFNFNFFDNDKPQESYDVMSALFNSVFCLGENASVYLQVDKKTGTDGLKFNRVEFQSFGNEYTQDVDKLQILDRSTNKVIHEYKINHKDYPLGFNRNPFTSYEYKYVAPGAYLLDEHAEWDNGNHLLDDIQVKVILKNGKELPQNKFFVNLGCNDFINDHLTDTKSLYLDTNEKWKNTYDEYIGSD